MKYPLSLLAATAVTLAAAGCSSGSAATSVPSGLASPSQRVIPSAQAPGSRHAASQGPSSDSSFCKLARQIGRADLGVSSGNLAADPTKLLGEVDRLNALAPTALKHDFAVFVSFEHSVLDPGGANTPKIVGDTTEALEHVSSYFAHPCDAG